MLRWVRRLGFFAALALGAVLFMAVGRPELCTSVWTWEHHVSPCCSLAGKTRWQGPRGDCCGHFALEERDPGASSVPIAVAPADFERVAPALDVPAAPAAQWLDPAGLVPERPPDRALRATVLLI